VNKIWLGCIVRTQAIRHAGGKRGGRGWRHALGISRNCARQRGAKRCTSEVFQHLLPHMTHLGIDRVPRLHHMGPFLDPDAEISYEPENTVSRRMGQSRVRESANVPRSPTGNAKTFLFWRLSPWRQVDPPSAVRCRAMRSRPSPAAQRGARPPQGQLGLGICDKKSTSSRSSSNWTTRSHIHGRPGPISDTTIRPGSLHAR
jgi:hypothetical protein